MEGSGRSPTSLDAFVASLRPGDAPATPGQFTLDPAVARQKLREFQLAEPWSYPVELVRAAVALGATQVDLVLEPGRVQVRFDGTPLPRAALADLFAVTFSDRIDPEARALRQLAVAVNAAQATGAERVTVTSGTASGAVALVAEPGSDAVAEVSAPASGTEVVVDYGLALLRGREDIDAAERSLTERARYAGIPVRVNGRTVSTGLTLAGGRGVTPFELPGGSGICGVLPELSRSEVRFVQDGVVIGVEPLEEPPGIVVVAAHPDLRTDLSHAAVLKDATYAAVRRSAGAAAAGVAARLHHDHVIVQQFSARRDRGKSRSLAAPGERPLDDPMVPDRFLSRRAIGSARLLEGLGPVLRGAGLALYLFPVLLVLKLVLFVLRDPRGDLVTVAFALCVVLFFSLLALWMGLYAVAGPAPERRRRFVLHATPLAPDAPVTVAPAALPARKPEAAVKGPFRVRGRARLLADGLGSDRTVASSLWWVAGDQAVRILALRRFAVEGPRGSVVVSAESAFEILGPHRPGEGRPALAPSTREAVSARLAATKPLRGTALETVLADSQGIAIEDGDAIEVEVFWLTLDGLAARELGETLILRKAPEAVKERAP
jgi:hypothetical protein